MTAKRGRPKGAAQGALKRRIGAAAAAEFAKAGYDGARIEAIARRAGCNRAMIYFYFSGKKGLFEAALDDVAEQRTGQMDAQPQSLAEGLIYWFRQNMAEPHRIRLVMQEALAPPLSSARAEGRRHYLERQLDVVRSFQRAGLLRSDVDARQLLTLFLAVTSFPASFPNVAAVSLAARDVPDMVERWSAGLTAVAELLSPPPD